MMSKNPIVTLTSILLNFNSSLSDLNKGDTLTATAKSIGVSKQKLHYNRGKIMKEMTLTINKLNCMTYTSSSYNII